MNKLILMLVSILSLSLVSAQNYNYPSNCYYRRPCDVLWPFSSNEKSC